MYTRIRAVSYIGHLDTNQCSEPKLLIAVVHEVHEVWYTVQGLYDFFFMYNHLESLFIEVILNNERIIIGSVYRKPRSSLEDFMYDYRKILHELRDRKAYIYSDFNLNLIQYETCNSVNNFFDLCFRYAYIPLINKPSTIFRHSANIGKHKGFFLSSFFLCTRITLQALLSCI